MIKFYNIKSKETRVAETEPMIAAFWASSDRGPNAHVGQDFGWRLAPETVVELRRIQNDDQVIRNIAQNYQKLPENVNESDVLKYISDTNSRATGMTNTETDFSREYEDEIRRLEDEANREEVTEEVKEVKQTKKESK